MEFAWPLLKPLNRGNIYLEYSNEMQISNEGKRLFYCYNCLCYRSQVGGHQIGMVVTEIGIGLGEARHRDIEGVEVDHRVIEGN